jgi:hypothetical protein
MTSSIEKSLNKISKNLNFSETFSLKKLLIF